MNFLNSKTIFAMVFVFCCTCLGKVEAQTSKTSSQNTSRDDSEHFYYYKGAKKYLTLNPAYIFVSGSSESDVQESKLNSLIKSKQTKDVGVDNVSQTLNKPASRSNDYPTRYWTEVELSETYSKKGYLNQIEDFKSNSNLIVAPNFKSETGEKISLSNYFYVKLKNSSDVQVLLDEIAIHDMELVGQNKFMPLWYTVSVKPNTPNAVKMANLFYETGLFKYAYPDLIYENAIVNTKSNMLTPNDPFFSTQWGLNNTGQSGGIAGLDINAEDAWDITKGSSDIKVAVVDEGFERNHPDLINNNFGNGFDAFTGTTPSVIHGPHGTTCAGIVAAESENNEGVSGVAPNCGLMSVAIKFHEPNTIAQLADGINWSWQNGADVITNSWTWISSPFIDDAIENALTLGRDGIGTVVVFASGNSNGAVAYPANGNPDVLAVGSMSPCGERKSPTSCDAESWWGSSFGNDLDVVAPGVLVTTTDETGSAGYVNGNYTFSFNGTSSACPVGAGVAALVLSVNSNLSPVEVNDIIEKSTQKVSEAVTYSYANTSGRPNGTWNNEMGYGLLDAYAAVLLAQATVDTTCDVDIFTNYPWIANFVNQNNCSNETIDVYQDGPHTFINVVANGVSTIYFNGQQWCVGAHCLDFYTNGAPVASWSCGCGVDCETIEETSFENGYGIWTPSGSYYTIQNSAFLAKTGTKSVYLSRNGRLTSNQMDLSGHDEVTIDFSLFARGMDDASDDIQIQYSINGGSTWISTASEDLDYGVDFQNWTHTPFSLTISAQYTSTTAFRFFCSTTNNWDRFNIDDITITAGCQEDGVIDYVTAQTNAPCYDADHVYLNIDCLAQPQSLVCGCDGQTYYNICTAFYSGLDSYTNGPCAGFSGLVVLNTPRQNTNFEEREIMEEINAPLEIRNFPNPFSNTTTIEFDLRDDSDVTLLVFDHTGRQVASLINDEMTTGGKHRVEFDASTLPPGMYIYTIKAGVFNRTGKMNVIKL